MPDGKQQQVNLEIEALRSRIMTWAIAAGRSIPAAREEGKQHHERQRLHRKAR